MPGSLAIQNKIMYFSEKWLDLDQWVILQWMTWERTWEKFLRENQGMRSNKEDRKAGVRGLAQTSLLRSTAFYIQLERSGVLWHCTEPSYSGVKSAGSWSHDVAQREDRACQMYPRPSTQRLRTDNSSLLLGESHAPRNWNCNPLEAQAWVPA